MPHPLYEMIEQVTDEKSFNRFLTALREDCEWHERNGSSHQSLAVRRRPALRDAFHARFS
jgi:hypothetical protein